MRLMKTNGTFMHVIDFLEDDVEVVNVVEDVVDVYEVGAPDVVE